MAEKYIWNKIVSRKLAFYYVLCRLYPRLCTKLPPKIQYRILFPLVLPAILWGNNAPFHLLHENERLWGIRMFCYARTIVHTKSKTTKLCQRQKKPTRTSHRRLCRQFLACATRNSMSQNVHLYVYVLGLAASEDTK